MVWTRKIVFALLLLTASSSTIRAQSVEESTVEAASEVLREIMAIPSRAIPSSLLADAQGVMIIPGMVKGGFVIGVRHGKGVAVTRNAAGEWVAPVFVTVNGGSFGLQVGLQSTDVIAVFRNRGGVERLMRDKFTLGADLSVAAGPVGREASAATDGQLRAEILSYSRSRGLFAGVAIDGAVIQVDHRAMVAYYAPRPGQPQGSVPASGVKLVEEIVSQAGPKHKLLINVKEVPALPPPANDLESVRTQLIESALRLHHVLDSQWKEFLALPSEVYAEGKGPQNDVLARCLDRYDVVTREPRYQSLSSRPEFRETHALLLRYRGALEGSKVGALTLPPPPR